MHLKNLISCLFIFLLFPATDTLAQNNRRSAIKTTENAPGQRWSEEKANAWYARHKWISGTNFLPGTAINQLEMWQESTFDTATLSRELGWANEMGFNTMRVFLHSLVWKQDPQGFKQRIDRYLAISTRHGIKTMFVFFDDCWLPDPKPGIQPEPKTGVHNSGWVQDPGYPASKDTTLFPALEKYVKDVMTHFANDERILLWDLYNEPGNGNKRDTSLPLVKKVFSWAREVNPSQPISVGLWAWDFDQLNIYQALNSDIITYHNYDEPEKHQRIIELLRTHGRPMICTEYMARTRNSRFSNIMPLLKRQNVGAINWGFVAGKSNTKFAWDTPMADGSEPIEWFHDILNKDGTPYRKDEVNLIKKLNSANSNLK